MSHMVKCPCGAEFEDYRYQFKTCPTCRAEGRRRHQSARVNVLCETCAKEFQRSEYSIKHFPRSFCCTQCKREAHKALNARRGYAKFIGYCAGVEGNLKTGTILPDEGAVQALPDGTVYKKGAQLWRVRDGKHREFCDLGKGLMQ